MFLLLPVYSYPFLYVNSVCTLVTCCCNMCAKITWLSVDVNELNLYLLQVKEAVYNTCPNAQYRT